MWHIRSKIPPKAQYSHINSPPYHTERDLTAPAEVHLKYRDFRRDTLVPLSSTKTLFTRENQL